MEWDHRPCTVYRLYNADRQLLYIGITFDWEMRANQHRYDKNWWPEVDDIHFTDYPSRISAALAERDAIVAELPLYNWQHHPDKNPTKGVHPVRRLAEYGDLPAHRVQQLTDEIKRLGLTREEASAVLKRTMPPLRAMPRTATSQEIDDARAQQAKRRARGAA